jgi:hypothetical protein
VATDAVGNVYVADYSSHRILKFTSNGVYLGEWGSFGGGNGQFNGPQGVGTDAVGNVYVADTGNNRIQKFTNTGTYLAQWGSPGGGDGQFSGPTGVATDAAGNVYIGDTGNNRIQKFKNTGIYLAQWGSSGVGDGQFNSPVGVAADASGNVYVADRNNNRIQKFGTSPAIALVSDIRNDQGRQVRLRVLRASADSPGFGPTILRYDVYRRIDPLPGAASALPPVCSAPDHAGIAPNQAQLAGWEQVGSFSARGDAEYNIVVPTLVDANSSSLDYSAFFVSAVTADPLTYFDSAVENGYSVDNFSPPAPNPFLAVYSDGGTHLHWGVSPAADFATFRLYRGTSADFVPGPGTLVVATADTGHVDVARRGGTTSSRPWTSTATRGRTRC